MTWISSMITTTPEEGFDLAVKLSRMAVKITQPDEGVRDKLRSVYEKDADLLTKASLVVATNFQTVAAANNYWIED